MRLIKKLIKLVVFLVIIVVLVVAGYFGYVFFTYSRIEDNQQLEVKNNGIDVNTMASKLSEKEFTIVTQNIGFGAYTPDFTFFMDGGHESWAKSKDSVIETVNKAATKVKSYDPDFVLFQEVDFDSTRSYHTNQEDILLETFNDYASVGAVNYHSAFLMYPLYQPHGSSYSEILSLSKYNMESSVRRSFPISTGISKLLDLDRCYSVSRVKLENDKELILYNVHMSAYGGSDEIRKGQMTMLFEDMKKEYDNGNYCVCGGDFNHDFTGDSTQVLNGADAQSYGWAYPFPIELLQDYEGIVRCTNYTSGSYTPTCRNCDVPYVEGNETFIVDGFLVSANVNVTYLENVDNKFEYSDHNPVVMKFTLS